MRGTTDCSLIGVNMSAIDSEVAEQAVPRGAGFHFRTAINRVLFRGMLFTMGSIAVGLYRVHPNKNVAWRFAKASARALARLCGVRVRVRGLERLTDGPYIFTPNHQSHFDIAALLGYLPGNNRFVAKKELFREPVLGLVLRTMGMVPVDRDDSASDIARFRRLGEGGYSTIIFPEGTRSLDGRLLPFKKGAFVAAIELGFPVVPIVCRGGHAVMPKGRYLSIYPGTVDLVILDPIPTTGMTYADRDRLRQLVFDRIAAVLDAR